MSTFLSQSCCVWKTLFPCGQPSSLALTVLPPPFMNRSLSFKERILMKACHLELNSPKSLTLHNVHLGSGLVPNLQEEATLICGYSSMSLCYFVAMFL